MPLKDSQWLEFYRELVTPRIIEEKMLVALRAGIISKWFSSYGQEAISVGCALALKDSDYILTLHRNLGVFTTRGVSLERLFSQFQGKQQGFSAGRERSFHFGIREKRIVGMISHLAAQLAVADGIALGEKLKSSANIALVFTGDGGSSEGDFHESLNLASVWDLPVLFIIENNGYALSTPLEEQFRIPRLSKKATGYGIEGISIDGNDLVKVYQTIHTAAQKTRLDSRPRLIECMTFCMRGHEEASGLKYVPKILLSKWGKKDPISRFEKEILDKEISDKKTLENIQKEIASDVELALESSKQATDPQPLSLKNLSNTIYHPVDLSLDLPSKKTMQIRFVDAISQALEEALKHWDNLIFMGQDVAEYGGVFKVSEGLYEKFGKDRIRNTPLCESAVVGACLGLSIAGYKSVMEMQFADFSSCAFNQIINNLAKSYFRWEQIADVVIRMPTGAGVGAGPFHSQSLESIFCHIPGLKVVYPASPMAAKGLFLSSCSDPNPVMFLNTRLSIEV